MLLLSILGFSYFEEINSKILGIFILCVFFFPFITWLLYKSFWNKGSKKIADFSDRIGDDPVKEIKRIFKGPST